VLNSTPTDDAAPQIHQFAGTINLGFSIGEDKRIKINVSLLLKRFMAFAKQTDGSFYIDPLNGSAQCIMNPSNIPTTKEGVERYYQHRIVAGGIRGKINVSMSKTMDDMKDLSTPFRKYLNNEKIYISQASLGLVDAMIIGVMLKTDPNLNFRDDIKTSIYDIMRDDTPISVSTKKVRKVNAKSDNPHFTNGLAIKVAMKDGKETEAYTEKLSKAMEFINEHGNHPILSQYVFVPFGRGAAIDPPTFCSLIRMQNECLHNIQHIEIHGFAGINIERRLGNDIDDGEDISLSIREIFLEASDDNGERLFHSIERTVKSDMTRAIFTKQHQDACNEILNEIDTCLSSKFIEAQSCISFQAHPSVKVFTSTIDQRKYQHQLKFNAYAQRIANRFCSVNPNETDESFDTAPLRIPKRRINISYAAAVTTPYHAPAPFERNHAVSPPNADIMDMSLHIPTHTGGNISSLAELEASLLSIQSESTFMQSDHTQLRNEFQKILTGVLKHSKEMQAIQSEVRGLTAVMQKFRNAIFPNELPLYPRSSFATLRIDDELATHQSSPMICAAPSSPPRKKLYRGDELPSTSLHTTTEDLQIESGTSLNPGECFMDAHIGLAQY
jgi:hypothetical protein